MKHILNKKISAVLIFSFAILLSSCLKNNKYYVDFGDYKAFIDIPLAAAHVNSLVPTPLTTAVPEVEWDVTVHVNSMDKPTKPVTATLSLDIDYLNKYNADNDAATKEKQQKYLDADPDNTVNDDDYPADYVPYELLPDSLYTIDTWTLTVQPGQREAHSKFMISASRLNTSHKYILPLTIKEASLTIGNWNHLLLNIQAKNIYDGKYSHTFSGALGSGKNSMTLSTINKTTSKSNLIGVYSNEIYYVVNPDNSVTVLDALDGSNTTVTDPSSYYDPDTETFHLKYKYYNKYSIEETLEKN